MGASRQHYYNIKATLEEEGKCYPSRNPAGTILYDEFSGVNLPRFSGHVFGGRSPVQKSG